MFTVQKDDRVQELLDDIQLDAFLKAGWEQIENGSQNEQSLDIDALKAEADALGVSYMPNIGAKKLAERIAEFKANQ